MHICTCIYYLTLIYSCTHKPICRLTVKHVGLQTVFVLIMHSIQNGHEFLKYMVSMVYFDLWSKFKECLTITWLFFSNLPSQFKNESFLIKKRNRGSFQLWVKNQKLMDNQLFPLQLTRNPKYLFWTPTLAMKCMTFVSTCMLSVTSSASLCSIAAQTHSFAVKFVR